MATRTRKKDNTVSQAVGTGSGVLGGAAAGAAAGSLAGPVGTAVGAVIGGVAGGFAGSAIAEAVDPAEEERYWEGEYRSRPYYTEGASYAHYRPAYRYGVEAANKYRGQSFSDVEKRLNRNWPRSRGSTPLTWSKAKGAVQDAYERTLRLHEERLNVAKETVNKGEVAVRKEVVTEHERIDVPVEREEVVITRKPAHGEPRPGGLTDAIKEAELRIPVKEERVKVTKETVPVEEVTVGRRKVRGVEKVDEKVRKEKLVKRTEGSPRVREEPTSL